MNVPIPPTRQGTEREKNAYTEGFEDGVAQGRQEALEELMESKAVEAAYNFGLGALGEHMGTREIIGERLKAAAIALGWKDPTGAEKDQDRPHDSTGD